MDRTSLACVRVRQGAIPSIFPVVTEAQNHERRSLKRKQGDSFSIDTNCEVSPTKKLKTEVFKMKSDLKVYQKKVKNLKLKNIRLVKKVATLKEVIHALREKIKLQEESCILLESISKTSDCLIKRCNEKSANPSMQKVYDDRLKAFAVTLHFLSPKAYTFVRKTFNTALPHARTLRRWYATIQGDPGFSTEVLRALKEYTTKSDKSCICALMFDCMAIRKHLEWDGKQFHGTVNVGAPSDDDSAPLAHEALVFHLVCINSFWKIPVGYFFVAGLNAEQLQGLVKQCIHLLHDSGIIVASLTCDGTSSNIATANKLGCKIQPEGMVTSEDSSLMVTSFPHPVTLEPIHFFLDAAHMLKLVRNTIGDNKILLDANNDKIEWKFIEHLNSLQKKEELHLGNKLTNSHILFHKQKMKVKLAAQVLSSSVADSLQFLNSSKLADFTGCEATIKFIRVFNKLFDVLNSRSIYAKYEKKAMCSENYTNHSTVLLEAKDYIFQLKDKFGNPIIKSKRKTGFLGFIVCIESALSMYDHFVGVTLPLKYIPFYKISQDHVERLFGYIRSRGGHNNNPTCQQFMGSFKRILIHNELHETNTGNSQILSKTLVFNIKKRYSNETEEINSSTPEWRSIEEEERVRISSHSTDDDQLVIDDVNCTDIAFNITEYVAGYVVRSLRNKIICEECINLLSQSEIRVTSLICSKNRGGLIQPSCDVHKICLICEKVLKNYLKTEKYSTKKNIHEKLTHRVLQDCVGMNLFHGSHHILEEDPESSHFVPLVKAVCKKYFNLRFRYHAKNFNDNVHVNKVRNKLCKTITFLGQ